MAKHTSKEAYFERLRNLADVNKPSLKESKIRNLGSLIDYKRAADGVAYGIVKENHEYFLKKAGTKQDPDVADFAYIGGLGNISNFKYKSLAEADKQRNMIFHTINEGLQVVDKNGSKKKKLNEGTASDEIDQATSKLGDLDTATSTEEMPAVSPEGGDEMAAGLGAKPAGETPAEEPAPEGEVPPAEDSVPAPEGGEEVPAPEAGLEGGEEVPAEEPSAEGDPDVAANTDGSIDEPQRELEKAVGKITNKIRKTEMEDAQVKSLINSYLSAFKDKLRDIDIEDRKEMANKILKVVGQEEIDDLGDTIPQDSPEDSELGPEAGVKLNPKPEEEPAMAAEQKCAECGSFPMYAESRGYDSPEKFMECDDEEKASVISGYANGHAEGQNDGDFKTIAIVITPEILEKLRGDYGHEDFANQVEPFSNEMNESTTEDKLAQLKEGIWGSMLGGAAKKIGGDIKKGVQKVGQAIGDKATQASQAVGKYATGVKQAAYGAAIPGQKEKLDKILANTATQINALNQTIQKSGVAAPALDVTMAEIDGQLRKLLTPAPAAAPAQGQPQGQPQPAMAENVAVDASNTEVSEPNMLKETDKKVAPLNTVVSEPNMLKEDDEELETDSPEHEAGETPAEEKAEHEEGGEEFGAEETPFEKHGDKPLEFAPAAQSLGVGTIKPEGAGVEISIEPDKSIQISMNESERKLRKYVRMRLEEKAGMRKANLNESKKSPALKKLDGVIDQQFKLYEGVILKKKGKVNEGSVNEIFGFGVAEKFKTLDPNDAANVEALFQKAYKNILINPHMSSIGDEAKRETPQEKYVLLKQYVDGGGGSLRLNKLGKLVYISAQQQSKGIRTPGAGGSTGLPGI
jgi:hypothetical protein